MSQNREAVSAPHLFARLTAELEDATTIAVKGQNAHAATYDHLKLARRVRAGLNRSTVLVDRIFEGLAIANVEGDQT